MALPLIERASVHRARPALAGEDGEWTYGELLDASERAAAALLDGRADLDGARVAFLVPPSLAHVAVQWGAWRAGGVAVPLCLSHPRPELEHTIADADAEVLVASRELAERLRPIAEERGLRLATTGELLTAAPAAARPRAPLSPLPDVDPGRRAMIVYTSGTTGKPKGAVTTHANLRAQIESLVAAWDWSRNDRILLVLPLHHVHGIVNVLCCALWSGATCEMAPRFDADDAWQRIAAGRLTLFMAVPTIYARLVAAWERAGGERRRELTAACRRMRLMVSGSAALPASLLERWREVSGHTLLERYGMTEIGMALSNPLAGPRVPGHVGTPLPGVEVRRVGEDGGPVGDSEPGEIEVRGPGVFLEYWRRPEETAAAFRDGWFRTGDVAVVEEGSYRILGRSSIDIIKTGGYKVSALEIEEALRGHPAVAECAVIGLPDPEWGERVAAAVELAPGAALGLEELRSWGRERLAAYKLPSRLAVVEALPRNPLGKVVKPELPGLFEAG